MNKITNQNISSRDTFRVECQKCKCKKISIEVSYGRFDGEDDDYYFKCKHCGFSSYINL